MKADSDLDIDFDALLSDDSDSEASDEEGGTLLNLSNKSWSARPQDVQEVDFMEDLVQFKNCQKILNHYSTSSCFFGNKTFKLIADIEFSTCKK